MALFDKSSQSPLGLDPGKAEMVRATMRTTAGNKGQVVYFDLAAGATATTASTAFGGETNPTANVVLATATHNGKDTTTKHLYGILSEDIAKNAQGGVYIRGVVQALGGDSSAAYLGLTPVAGSELGAITDETRCCAIALETMANATLKWVIFDGINGFGTSVDVVA